MWFYIYLVYKLTNVANFNYLTCHHFLSERQSSLKFEGILNRPGVAGAVLQSPPSLTV